MDEPLNNLSLQPVTPNLNPGDEYAPRTRLWQGIPTLERSSDGRLWAAWYSGNKGERPGNYVLLVRSPDDGASWSAPVLVIAPSEPVRAFDPCLWSDPGGHLWLFWAQSCGRFDGRCGVWAICCNDPRGKAPLWSTPTRMANGIMMNKPTVLSSGEWLMPAAVWNREPRRPQLDIERKSNVFCSMDQGRTWALRGSADVPERTVDEHMLVERRDGSLWMLVRTSYGIGESFSFDHGFTWSAGQPSAIEGPNSRFFIRRLRSGRLLLVNHYSCTVRSDLTAALSEDEGRSWGHHLMLDERPGVSYPDGIEAPDGRICIIYDRDRHGAKEILMAVFTEDGMRTSTCTGMRLKTLVNRAG